ncbi:MAG TPA: flagellar basal-body MS-ring/collar protein FliF [Xanthobacteraceae bacterium]|nr:flagellar basal-body MS-ring/collar protein FliF [Xanthobacteraceae bacterium]
MQGLLDFLKTLGAARMAAMAAVTLSLVAFFAFIILRITAPQMTLLFNDLPPADSGAIIKELDRQGIAYELQSGGSSILVPREQVARLRVRLAEAGLPKGGGVGYEIFDKSDVLGATSFVQNINRLRALEGELARTIQAIDRVQGARVHLVLPERPLFSRDKFEPSASIVLNVRGQLEPQQVRAIRHLVATAVNGLRPERISIVDEAGRLLANGSGDADAVLGAGFEQQQAFERRLREQVEAIMASVVGPGRARVQIAAEFDVNRITETSDRFDPEGRVVRSSQTREEQSATSSAREGQVTASNELPGAAPRPGEAAGRDQARKSEEIVNYEISRTTKTQVIEGARVKRISAAVVVDGIYARNEKGESVYQPRSKEEMERITALVRSAIGFNEARGDRLEVVNLRFADGPTPALSKPPSEWSSLFDFTKEDILRGAELAVLSLLGALVLLIVVRPLVRRVLAPEERPLFARGAEPPGLIAATAAAPPTLTAEVESPPTASDTAKLIDIVQVKGQLHAQSVQKVGELADRNPEETVAIIRHWLHESA